MNGRRHHVANGNACQHQQQQVAVTSTAARIIIVSVEFIDLLSTQATQPIRYCY